MVTMTDTMNAFISGDLIILMHLEIWPLHS